MAPPNDGSEQSGQPEDLEDVLDELLEVSEEHDPVSIAQIQETVGRRAYGSLLLVFGIIVLTPAGGIPGVPTMFGVIVLLISGQLLIGMESFWLPRAIADRAIDAEKVRDSVKWIRPKAAWVDGLLRPRLTFVTRGRAVYAIALACVVLACGLPALELLPFAATAPAAAITAFGLALVTGDGVLAIAGYLASALSAYLIGSVFFF